jgi:formate dehydrogenase maturation protein FdhE
MLKGRTKGHRTIECSHCHRVKDTVGTYCKHCRSEYSNEWQKLQRMELKLARAQLKAIRGQSVEDSQEDREQDKTPEG